MKSKEEFLAWLRSLPADTKFCEGMRIETCPIAKFTGQQACTEDLHMPEWATTFMEHFDGRTDEHPMPRFSLKHAIQIAEAL